MSERLDDPQHGDKPRVTHRFGGPYHERLEYLINGRALTMEEVKGYLNHALSTRSAGTRIPEPDAPTVEDIEEFRRENIIHAHVGETPAAGLEPWAIKSNRVLDYLCYRACTPQSASEASPADYEEVLADQRRLCRELDAILSYPDEPARQASLCDLIPFAKSIAARARRYYWLNGRDNFLVQIDDKPVRLKCGDVLDRWIDARLAEENATGRTADRNVTR